MRRIKQHTLHEYKRFERLGGTSAPPTDAGITQFHVYESTGKEPDNPDPYFTRLLDGKKWWEWTLNEYASLFKSAEWYGFEDIKFQFEGDLAGFRQIVQRIQPHPTSTAWVMAGIKRENK